MTVDPTTRRWIHGRPGRCRTILTAWATPQPHTSHSLLVSVCGENLVIPTPRDERIPEGTLMSSGYTPGVPRLGVPALLMSDASMD
jgi:hypothetical protein